MTKKDLISRIAEETGITKRDSEMMFDKIVKVITDELAETGEIRIAGLGTFRIGTVAETTRFNALAGGTKTYPEHKRIRFKPGKELRDRISK